MDGRQPTADEAGTDGNVAVHVPDLSGVRLSTARRQIRSLGLKIKPTDRYGDRIYPGTHRFYRVQSQKHAAGGWLKKGEVLEVQAHRIGSSVGYASGY